MARRSAVLLTTLAAAATLTAVAHPAQAAPQPATLGPTITCQRVDDSGLPTVRGQRCNINRTGPLSDFIIQSRDLREKYRCEQGWAYPGEVIGEECEPID